MKSIVNIIEYVCFRVSYVSYYLGAEGQWSRPLAIVPISIWFSFLESVYLLGYQVSIELYFGSGIVILLPAIIFITFFGEKWYRKVKEKYKYQNKLDKYWTLKGYIILFSLLFPIIVFFYFGGDLIND